MVIVDGLSPPSKQISAKICIQLIEIYQLKGRDILENRIACRYEPTCSEYTKQAIQTYGIARGIYLGVGRILSCTQDVPLKTEDRVPSCSS